MFLAIVSHGIVSKCYAAHVVSGFRYAPSDLAVKFGFPLVVIGIFKRNSCSIITCICCFAVCYGVQIAVCNTR